jgi:hypothetical protein
MACTRLEISRIIHEANRAICQAFGDDSQPPWESIGPWQRSATFAQIDFTRDNPFGTPKDHHEAWRAKKLADGWKPGPVKDPEKKEHPCLVPFAELPPEQRAKDYVLRAIALAWLQDQAKPPEGA